MANNIEKDIIDVPLKTAGNDIVFHFLRTRFPQQARLYITIETQPSVGQHKITSIEEIVDKDHLMGLCEYLLDHVAKLKENPSPKSPEYVDDTVLYIVQAYSGYWDETEHYGIFNLRFLINIGKSDTGKRVFLGSETKVDSREIIKFYERIKK